ncbi:hypothetical protein ACFXKR_34050 [Streptomyces violascens]|uniref:hypothetical protein n=1 Tax=Streptomyces violascens TaxID=67381 RepID=UPI00369225B3
MTSSAHQLPAVSGPFAVFTRFALYDGGIGVAASVAVALVALLLPWAVANALVTVASTVLATEVNARFAFGAGRRADRRQHLESAGSAAAAYAVTCGAMAVLHLAVPSPGVLCDQLVYLSASALAGIGRFVVLRMFVFTAHRSRERALPVRAPGAVAEDVRTAPSPVPHAEREGAERLRPAAGPASPSLPSPRAARCYYRPHGGLVRPATSSAARSGMRFVGRVGGHSGSNGGAARPGRASPLPALCS